MILHHKQQQTQSIGVFLPLLLSCYLHRRQLTAGVIIVMDTNSEFIQVSRNAASVCNVGCCTTSGVLHCTKLPVNSKDTHQRSLQLRSAFTGTHIGASGLYTRAFFWIRRPIQKTLTAANSGIDEVDAIEIAKRHSGVNLHHQLRPESLLVLGTVPLCMAR